MSRLLSLPALQPLPKHLAEAVVDWTRTLIEEHTSDKNKPVPTPEQIIEELRELVANGTDLVPGVPDEDWETLCDWEEDLDNSQMVAVVEKLLTRKQGFNPTKVLPSQIQVIEETQEEIGVDFTNLLPLLDRQQADVICKGLIVRSEVIRNTRGHFLRLGDLRRAIRAFLRGV